MKTLSDKQWECVQGAFLKSIYDAQDVRDAVQRLIKQIKYLVPTEDEIGVMVQESIQSIFGNALCVKGEVGGKT